MANSNLTLLDSIIEEYTKDNFLNKEMNKDHIFEVFGTDKYFKKYDFSFEDIKNGLVGGKKTEGLTVYIF